MADARKGEVWQNLALFCLLGPRLVLYTPLSESRSGLGGLLGDIGPILGVLGVMVNTN